MSDPTPPSDASHLYAHIVRDVTPVEADASRRRAGPCPVCNDSASRARFAMDGSALVVRVCDVCGTGWLDPMPGTAEVAAFYPDVYYGEPGLKFQPLVESLVRLVGARHVRFLASGLPPGGRVLDVGCGRGVLLSSFAERGFEAHGMEVSEAAVRGADPRARIRVAPDLVAAGYPDEYFDQVIVWHVLEHLRDPRGTLAEVRRILRPGGRLVVAVPNFGSLQARWAGPAWFHLDLPRHLYHFPASALRRMLESEGFACESDHHFSFRQNPFGWVQSALNRMRSIPRNGLYVLLQRRPPGEPVPYDAATRWRLRLAWLLGMPLGFALSLVTTALRSGATVHVVARRRSRE